MNPLISILKRDITDGVKRDSCNCMVTRALKRKYPNRNISAHTVHAKREAQFKIGHEFFHASEATYRRMVDFDTMRPVEPFKFRLSAGMTGKPKLRTPATMPIGAIV